MHTSHVELLTTPTRDTAERRLLRAMLEDCLRTLLGRPTSERGKWQRRDLAWIMSEDRDDVFAFENVCDALGIDPSYLRGEVLTALLRAQSTDGRA